MTFRANDHKTAAALAIVGSFGPVAAAQAQSCDATISNVSFGAFDVTAGTAVDTTANVAINCTGVPLLPVRVCINLGQGSGGTDVTNRLMVSGPQSLRFSLFQDAARSTVWGTGSAAVSVDVPIGLGGSGSASATIYGRIYSSQPTAPAGSYISTFTGNDAMIDYGLLSILLNCTILVTTKTTTFNATATVSPTCRVTANNLNFGTTGVLATTTDGTTSLAPVCTNGTTYQIGLDGGLSGATDPTQRNMTKGAETILYGLYRDAARSQPFGNTIGVNSQPGTGTGLAQSVPVYGRIPAQTTPTPGTYTDTVVVTVTY